MPRYKLRTLLIVLALGPPLLAGAWFAWQACTTSHDFVVPEIHSPPPDGLGPL